MIFCRFQQFLELANTFIAKGFSETRPFMHFNKHIFKSKYLQKYVNKEVLFSKRSKFNVNFKNVIQIPENVFGFEDNGI